MNRQQLMSGKPDDMVYEPMAYKYAESKGIPATYDNINAIIAGMMDGSLNTGGSGSNLSATPSANAELDVFGDGPTAVPAPAPAMPANAPTAATPAPSVPNSPASAPRASTAPVSSSMPAMRPSGAPSNVFEDPMPTVSQPAAGTALSQQPSIGELGAEGIDTGTLLATILGGGAVAGGLAYAGHRMGQRSQPNLDDMMSSSVLPAPTMSNGDATRQFQPPLRGPASPIGGPSATVATGTDGPASRISDRPPTNASATVGSTSTPAVSPTVTSVTAGGSAISNPMTASGNATGAPIETTRAAASIDELLGIGRSPYDSGLMDINLATARGNPSVIPPSISGQDAMSPQLASSGNPMEEVNHATSSNVRATEIIIAGQRVPVVAMNTGNGIQYVNQQGEVFSPQAGKFVPSGRMTALPDEIKRAFATAGRAIR
jgi:hypothetical protein